MKNLNKKNNYEIKEELLNQKYPFKIDSNYIREDLLFFKDDVLKDIRKSEEKLNSKIEKLNKDFSEIKEVFQKKIENLSNKLSHINIDITDNKNLHEKIKNFQPFISKTENDLLTLNLKLNATKNDVKDSYYKYEKLINENIIYPGIIGNNARFPNFRNFIDFVLSNIHLIEEFKEEIKSLDFNDYKIKINSEIKGLRFQIDNIRCSKYNIDNSIKESITKLQNFNYEYDKKLNENTQEINSFKLKIDNDLNKFNQKIDNVQKDLNDKYLEQVSEIKNIKEIKIQNINNDNNSIKNIFNENNNEKNILEIKNINFSLLKPENSNSHKIQQKSNEDDILNKKNEIENDNINFNQYIENKNKKIIKEITEYKKNNLTDSSNYIDLKNITEKSVPKIYTKAEYAKLPITAKAKLYKKLSKTSKNMVTKNKYFQDIFNKKNKNKNNFEVSREEEIKTKNKSKIIKKEQSEDYKIKNKTNFSFQKKIMFPNNYSITNIPNIEIKKVILPDQLNISSFNNDCLSNSPLSDRYFKTSINKGSTYDNKNYSNDNNTYNKNKNILDNIYRSIKNKTNDKKVESSKLNLYKSRNDILEPNKTNFTYEKCKSQKEIRIPSSLGKTTKNEKCKELFNNKYEYLL